MSKKNQARLFLVLGFVSAVIGGIEALRLGDDALQWNAMGIAWFALSGVKELQS